MPNPKDTKEETMNKILETLKNGDNEGTDSPYWVILNKLQLSSRKDVIGDKYYHGITGIFFSREDAEAHLKSRKYAFSEDAQVWCLSGYWSQKYKKLWREIEDEKRTGVTHFPGCHKVHIECANKAIDEARQILFDEAFLKERGLRLATEWLERWRVEE